MTFWEGFWLISAAGNALAYIGTRHPANFYAAILAAFFWLTIAT